jgi:DNA invertase Pin-like site-specific DNA recombinase
MGSAPDKICAHHRDRTAYVYVRQSTTHQVQHNRESQQNQYALVQRALALGWIPERVQVIDADLGQFGQDGSRSGFRELVADVSLGRVGIVFAYEASRLARNNTDWYALLDLATVVGTLIADADGIYDPRNYNDRMLLGLRGIFSEAELPLLHLRLAAGRMRQVERGTYRHNLPTGLVRLADGRVAKDPDQQVQRTIALVFERFLQLGTCQKVLRSFRDDGLLLPRRQTSGLHAGQLLWKKPSEAALDAIIGNPADAGAFVYGRRGPHPSARPGHRSRVLRRSPEEWTAVHQGASPQFISWEQFVANQERLGDNASRYAARARGAPREGRALLPGLAVCGHCGHPMRVVDKARYRYVCNALNEADREGQCLSLEGAAIDAAVVEAFFAAIAPAELDLLEEVLAAQHADRQRLAQQYADRVKRAEYEARLAQRQYDAIDPDNRLVAAELERRWELALRGLAEAREAAERFAQSPPPPGLDPTLRAQLSDLGRQLPDLWESERLTLAQKKELLRSLIRRAILDRPTPDTIAVKVVWVSGAVSVLAVQPTLLRGRDLGDYADLVARILELGTAGYHDREIAQRLSAEGFRSARRPDVPRMLVEKVRAEHGQVSLTEQFRRQDKIDGCWTTGGLCRSLNVHYEWLRRRIQDGTVPAIRHPMTGKYLIADDPTLIERLKIDAVRR